MFTLSKKGNEYYTVDTATKTVGEIYREVDGFFVFAFTSQTVTGCFAEYFFTFVSKSLQSLNDDWAKPLGSEA